MSVNLSTDRLLVRLGDPEDAAGMVAYRLANRDHLIDHGPASTWSPESLTESYWRNRFEESLEEFRTDQSVKLVIFEKNGNSRDRTIIGTINFTGILRRAAQYCVLGYGLDRDRQGRGYMTEALRAAIDFMFRERNLHRIMANYVPTNQASGRVLRKLGFDVDGYARDYLYLNGVWRDHILCSLTNDRWDPELTP